MTLNQTIEQFETDLNHFDAQVRSQALAHLAGLYQSGQLNLAPESDRVNMHCHTFFSFNAYGYSPSALAWLAKKEGYRLIGMVDFDTLNAVDEFFNACDLLGVRGSAGIETRVYLPEFADREINSPGEPGVSYMMGIGFTTGEVPPETQPILADISRRVTERNQTVLQSVNAFLNPLTIDYHQDVLPLTPGGNATERHIVLAYQQAASRQFEDPAAFWAEKLATTPGEVSQLMADSAAFQNQLRKQLIKRGGPGYIQPNADSFPVVEDVNRLIAACGAIPCFAWLDGSTQGEQDIEELLVLLMAKGVAALNIVPDRNWNFPDAETRRQKVHQLTKIVTLARNLALPLNVGTEMNSFGQKRVDDFNVPALRPFRQDFIDGATFVYGHTALQRGLGCGFQSEWAKAHFPQRPARNHFFTQLGRRVPPGSQALAQLRATGRDASPDQLLALFA